MSLVADIKDVDFCLTFFLQTEQSSKNHIVFDRPGKEIYTDNKYRLN